jgi:Arc/MetJ-type ribon-helix-helix transcriptional regulator
MKTSTLPPLRVSPELRAEAEAVLAPGESLSSFVHDAVTRTIEFRRSQQEFVARGLASAANARRTGRYVSSDAALKTLRRQLEQGRRQARKP